MSDAEIDRTWSERLVAMNVIVSNDFEIGETSVVGLKQNA